MTETTTRPRDRAAALAAKRLILYPTPAPVVRALLSVIELGPARLRVLEPCAGDGAIVRELIAWGVPAAQITAIELADDARLDALRETGCEVIRGDALAWAAEATERFDLVITNPPFGMTISLTDALLPLTVGSLFMYERAAFGYTLGRADWHRNHPSDEYRVSPRPSHVVSGETDKWEYAWYRWDPGRPGAGRIYHLPNWREFTHQSTLPWET